MAATTKLRYCMTFSYQASKYSKSITFFAASEAKAQAVSAACRAKLVKGAGVMLTKVVEESLGRDNKIAKQIPNSLMEDGDVNLYITFTCSGEDDNRTGKWTIPFQQSDAVRNTVADAIVTASNKVDIAWYDKKAKKALIIDGYLSGGKGSQHDRFTNIAPSDGLQTGDDYVAPNEIVTA